MELELFEAYKEKVTADEESYRRFLIELGVIDKDGTPMEPYKNLCIYLGLA